jgi:signal peptidase I
MGKIFRTSLWIAAILGIVIGVLRLVAIRWWQVPMDDPILEASLAPTLHGGDWVVLWRATSPRFGGLLLCPDPDNAGRFVIARMLGEANDKLTIDGDRVEVNDHSAQTETACNDAFFTVKDPSTGGDVELRCDLEGVGGVLHERGGGGNMVRTIPPPSTRTVTAGHIYLVSDNRVFPYDSRVYGSIQRSLCKESIFFRLVSKQGFTDVANRLTYIR